MLTTGKKKELLDGTNLRMDEMQEHNSIEYKNLAEELSAINRMTKLDPFGKEVMKNGEAGIKRIKELIEKGRSKGVLT